MIAATALLLTVLCTGTPQEPVQPGSPAAAPSAGQQRIASGLVLAAGLEGRISVFDNRGQLVVELDKPAGRQLEVALEPGAYEVRLGTDPPRVVRFQIGDRDKFVLDAPRVEAPAAMPPPPWPPTGAVPAVPAPSRLLDARHLIEVRFGGWADGWFDGHHDWDYAGSAHGAFGLEYLRFLRNDIGVGLALTATGEAQGWSDAWDEQGTAHGVVSLPVMVRWYPARRYTRARAVEPYLTTGAGVVFGVIAAWSDDDPHDWNDWNDWYHGVSSTRVSTAFGGRVGGGVDFRLGSVFTLGLAGAWNWNTGLPDDLWYRPDLHGGEFTVTMGWQFGR